MKNMQTVKENIHKNYDYMIKNEPGFAEYVKEHENDSIDKLEMAAGIKDTKKEV